MAFDLNTWARLLHLHPRSLDPVSSLDTGLTLAELQLVRQRSRLHIGLKSGLG